MRKYHAVILALILFFSVPFSARSQGKFSLLAEGGPSMASIHGRSIDKSNITPVVGGFAGLSLQYALTGHLALRGTLAYERKGADFLVADFTSGSGDYLHINYRFQYDYLTIPLLIRATIGKTVRFSATAGPYFSVLLDQTYLNNDHTPYFHNGIYPAEETYSNSNGFDFGVAAGVSVEVNLSKRVAVSLEVRDHYGVADTKLFPVFTDDSGTIYHKNQTSYNNALIAGLGIWYRPGW